LDSECRKWHFRASNFNNFLGEDALPIYLRCRPHTWPWSLLSPSNILSHRKVPFHKIPPPPPTGKSLMCPTISFFRHKMMSFRF
jgi:hypothetical protein